MTKFSISYWISPITPYITYEMCLIINRTGNMFATKEHYILYTFFPSITALSIWLSFLAKWLLLNINRMNTYFDFDLPTFHIGLYTLLCNFMNVLRNQPHMYIRLCIHLYKQRVFICLVIIYHTQRIQSTD